jgi:hypothetical protein
LVMRIGDGQKKVNLNPITITPFQVQVHHN